MVNFEDGQLLKGAYAIIDGKEYPVIMPKCTGQTPLTSENLNKLQTDIQENLKNGLKDLIKFEEFTKSVTVNSNEYLVVTMGELTVPDGYIFLGCTPVVNGYADQFLVSYSKYGSNIIAMIYNKYFAQLQNELRCKAIFIKDYNNIDE